jgi:hypothetical protein
VTQLMSAPPWHLSGAYHPGFYGWLVAHPVRFATPIPAAGRQKLFTPDNALQSALHACYRAASTGDPDDRG